MQQIAKEVVHGAQQTSSSPAKVDDIDTDDGWSGTATTNHKASFETVRFIGAMDSPDYDKLFMYMNTWTHENWVSYFSWCIAKSA